MKNLSVTLLCFVLLSIFACSTPVDPKPIDNKPSGFTNTMEEIGINGRDFIVKSTGDKIVFQGVCFTGGIWEYSLDNDRGDLANVKFLQTENDFQKVKSWGANLVTFYINYYWFDTGAHKNEAYVYIDEMLRWCRDNDLYILFTLACYPEGLQRGTSVFFNSATAKNNLKQFWIDFATYYKGHNEILGYSILYEPEGTNKASITTYETEVIDAVRTVDNDKILFVEPEWANPINMIHIDRTNLAYNPHFFEPFYINHGGAPWIASGGIPTNISYPGNMVTNINYPYYMIQPANFPTGSHDWTNIILTNSDYISNDIDMVFPKIFVNSETNGIIWIDNIRFSTNSDPIFYPVMNHSFEEMHVFYSDTPAYWSKYISAEGSINLDNTESSDGSYSMCFSNCTDWTEIILKDWIGTVFGIPLTTGDEIRISFDVKTSNIIKSSWAFGAVLEAGDIQEAYYDKNKVQEEISNRIVLFASTYNVPILLSEICVTKTTMRPDSINYLNDVIDSYQTNGFSWIYYNYREDHKYLGIYSGTYGQDIFSCVEDTAIIDMLISQFSN